MSLVAAIAGGGDDPDPLRPLPGGTVLEEPVDEVAQRHHCRCVVAVIDDDLDPLDLGHVHPARCRIVRRCERPQPGTDVVQVRARAVRGARGGHRVLHVEHRLAAEGGGQQVRVGQRHSATPVLQDDQVAQFPRLQDHGLAAAPCSGPGYTSPRASRHG
jgi:hypothetical protein